MAVRNYYAAKVAAFPCLCEDTDKCACGGLLTTVCSVCNTMEQYYDPAIPETKEQAICYPCIRRQRFPIISTKLTTLVEQATDHIEGCYFRYLGVDFPTVCDKQDYDCERCGLSSNTSFRSKLPGCYRRMCCKCTLDDMIKGFSNDNLIYMHDGALPGIFQIKAFLDVAMRNVHALREMEYRDQRYRIPFINYHFLCKCCYQTSNDTLGQIMKWNKDICWMCNIDKQANRDTPAIFKVWDMGIINDYTSHLQWLPEEVLIDVVSLM